MDNLLFQVSQRPMFYKHDVDRMRRVLLAAKIKNNMTPKIKAKQLFDKMADTIQYNGRVKNTTLESNAKECALILCDEILNGEMIWNVVEGQRRIFWNKVKEEIKNI